MTTNHASAQTVIARCDALRAFSEEPDRLTRRFATDALKQAMTAAGHWMRAAGMQVRQDNIGNLHGRYPALHENALALLLGSHLDSVRDAGKYDGPLGVLVALAVVERLHAKNVQLPFAIEVLAFADEEGVRYHTAYLGSSVVAGTFDRHLLDRTDADGIAMRDAITAFGGHPVALTHDRYQPQTVLGYVEVHIEQGPVLEAETLPVGVVTTIQAQSRIDVQWTGIAGHAGTVPMALRRDALVAAAEFVQAVETIARETSGLVATVGQFFVQPGASNVIPGRVTHSLDVRHPDDATLQQAMARLHETAQTIAAARTIDLHWDLVQQNPSVPCTPGLRDRLAQAVEGCGFPARLLPSGAGHDGVVLSTLTDIAMLFVRCEGGISHNPAESVRVEDVAVAIDVLERFIMLFADSMEQTEQNDRGNTG